MKKYIILIIFITIVLALLYIILKPKEVQKTNINYQNNTDIISNEMEEFLKEDKPTTEHKLDMEIIRPVEDKIFPGQARNYVAYIEGNSKYQNAKINCLWKFYLNENNEEVLYKELNNSSMISYEPKEICGFTNTFMDKIGLLRVELTAEITTFTGELLETVVADRDYVVAK